MNSYERLRAMVEGKPVDRPGVSVWKHFFLDDRVVEDNVKAHIAFQERNNWDVIKVMANGVHMQEQYGAEITWSRRMDEFPFTSKHVINSPRGFRELKTIDVKKGAIAREVEVVKRLMDRYKGKVPVLATVFTPTTYALELYCGGGGVGFWPFGDLVRYYADDLKEGLKVLTDMTYQVVEEYVKTGVDGIFYASQLMNDRLFTPEIYEELARPYDLQAYEPALGKTWLNVMHIHGQTNLFMEIVKDYPHEILSWEDIITNVSLKQAKEMYPDRIMMAGIERWNDFREENRDRLLENMVARVKAASEAVSDNRLIIATGCSQASDIPDYRFDTLKQAMDMVYGPDEER